jgi:hypothetical protein
MTIQQWIFMLELFELAFCVVSRVVINQNNFPTMIEFLSALSCKSIKRSANDPLRIKTADNDTNSHLIGFLVLGLS